MGRINRKLLPIKAHFFFFFAAIGPILPQLNVFGKQLGISPAIMGIVTGFLPFFWALAKPAIGFLVDYFHKQRKLIFMLLIAIMSSSYFCMFFLPQPPQSEYEMKTENMTTLKDFRQSTHSEQFYVNVQQILPPCDEFNIANNHSCMNYSKLISASCGWVCANELVLMNEYLETNQTDDRWNLGWQFWLEIEDVESAEQTLNVLYFNSSISDETSCKALNMVDYKAENSENTNANNKTETVNKDDSNLQEPINSKERCIFKSDCKYLSCAFFDEEMKAMNLSMSLQDNAHFVITDENYNLYGTITFWGFVIFMCVGTVAFNVANCIGDAVCFDVLGPENGMKYGFQRAFGTAGYGLTAFISGWLIDYWSGDQIIKDFTPAFILIAIFTVFDMYFCKKLELPRMSRPQGAGGTLIKLLKERTIFIFIIFAVIAGVFDSFIIYYMFWFLEEVATESGNYGNIKMLEGLIIAVESFGGEILFFTVSGKILKYLGFRNTLTLSLLCYSLRLLSISLITEPWHLVIVEMFLQGPTYALCYSTIVGYAAAVAPPGLSATLQGIMAGMDDGVGFAIGSFLGGYLYYKVGGRLAFRIFAVLAIVAAIAHGILGATLLKHVPTGVEDEYKDDTQKNGATENCLKNSNNDKSVKAAFINNDDEAGVKFQIKDDDNANSDGEDLK